MPQDRRQFLASALTAAPLFVPRSAWGANDRLAYGLIGAGGRGRYLQGNFQKLGAECVAMAEVYEPNLQNALKTTPDAKPYVEYHDLLAQSGIAGATGGAHVGEGAFIAGRAGVFDDVPAKARVWGFPALPERRWLRAMAWLARLPELAARVRALEKKLGLRGGEEPE